MKLRPRLPVVCALFLAAAVLSPAAEPVPEGSVLRPADRIVFVGDSITGQGANSAGGWAGLIGDALRGAHPESSHTLVSLGGSGQGVASWQNVEKKSRAESVILDVKTVDVRAALDQRADVMISLLGMNDVLFPRLKDRPEDYDAWAERYRELIRTLRARSQPRVFALATPTLCTEDPDSPKNRAMAWLIERIERLAAEENCLVLPTNAAMREILDQGRAARPDFHVTSDSVHPNAAGHVAIAVGMLRGLGESRAAGALLARQAPALFKKEAISYRIERLTPPDSTTGRETFRIRVFVNASARPAALARLTPPAGWTLRPPAAGQPADVFVIDGRPDRLVSRLQVEAAGHTTEIGLPAPWLIGIAGQDSTGWSKTGFDPAKKPLDADAWFARGERFGEPGEVEPGRALRWHRYVPSVDYGGGAAPGAIDFAGVAFFQNFDVAYGVRWIQSPDTRPLTLQVERLGFASGSYLTVWLNGENIHAGPLAAARTRDLAVTLRPGWNALVFKSNNFQTQWQFALHLKGDGLDALRIAATPPAPSPAP